jgi:Pyridine nucleotide-disulphide oxidoreductase, dimerisation domain
VSKPKLDWAALIDREKEMIGGIPESLAETLEERGVDRASFVWPNAVKAGNWFSTRSYAETKAWAKVIVDEVSDLILGAHMVGHAAEELINIFGLAKKHGITATELRDFIYAYPSFSSDIKHML